MRVSEYQRGDNPLADTTKSKCEAQFLRLLAQVSRDERQNKANAREDSVRQNATGDHGAEEPNCLQIFRLCA